MCALPCVLDVHVYSLLACSYLCLCLHSDVYALVRSLSKKEGVFTVYPLKNINQGSLVMTPNPMQCTFTVSGCFLHETNE